MSFDLEEKSLYEYLVDTGKGVEASKDVMLVQCVEDLYLFGLFGQIALSMRERHAFRVEQYVLRSLRVGESKNLFTFIASRLLINPLHTFKWVRLYRAFCDGIGYRSTSIRPLGDIMDLYRAWVVWRRLTDRDTLIGLKIGDVVVGDLVNDSYLRFKPAPTVYLKDVYLLILLWQAHRDFRRAECYFSRARPKLYLTSYSTYIQHGIPVRVALKHGTQVYSFGNYQEFSKKLSLQDWVHTRNPDHYARDFAAMDAQEEKLAMAEAALLMRLSGGVDSATAYMKQSAYAETGASVPDVRGAVVVFLHDFYDSPHVYREMVFPDFWEWTCFTIETLSSLGTPFFLKPHPNHIDLSDAVLADLKHRYPDVHMLPTGVTNKKLAEAGMACAVTVYGTVAHEMAFLGVPSIACAHHPHISFDFCRTAKSRSEYAELLRSYSDPNIDKSTMHRQSLAFYFMHNMNMASEEQNLRDWMLQYRRICMDHREVKELVIQIESLVHLLAYKQWVAKFCMFQGYA